MGYLMTMAKWYLSYVLKCITLFLAYATLIENDSNPEVSGQCYRVLRHQQRLCQKLLGDQGCERNCQKAGLSGKWSSVLCGPVLKRQEPIFLKYLWKNIWHAVISSIEIFMDRV